jgi:hypothetical protein
MTLKHQKDEYCDVEKLSEFLFLIRGVSDSSLGFHRIFSSRFFVIFSGPFGKIVS